MAARTARAIWPEFLVVVFTAFAYHPTIRNVAHIPYDAEFFHYPLLRTVQGYISGGHLPAWDPDPYGGLPLLSNTQSAWLYPPHLILAAWYAVAGGSLTERALDLLVIGHVALGAVGTCVLVRRRGLGPAAGIFAGVFAVTAGEYVAQTQHVGMVESYAWLPWSLCVVDAMSRGVTPRKVALLGVLFALIVTPGFVPVVLAATVLIIGWSLLEPGRRGVSLGGSIAGVALGGLIATAALLPAVLLSSIYPPESPHPGLTVAGLTTAVIPNAYGHWVGSPLSFTGPNGLTNSYFYIGGAAIVLLPIAVLSGRAALRELTLVGILALLSFGALATKLVSALVSVGQAGGLWRPEDFAYVLMIPLAVLLSRALARRPSIAQLVAAAVFLLVMLFIPLPRITQPAVTLIGDGASRTLLAAGVALVGLAGMTLVSGRRPRVGAAIAVVIACVAAVELASAVVNRTFVNWPGPPTSAGPTSTGDGSPVLAVIRRRLPSGARVMSDVQRLPPAWLGFSDVWGLPDVNGYQPQFSRYELNRVGRAVGQTLTSRTFPITESIAPVLHELNARLLVLSASQDPFANDRRYPLVYADEAYHVRRVSGSSGRAYGIRTTCVQARGADQLTACIDATRVSATVLSPTQRRYRVGRLATGSLVMTGEPWYPGWSASSGATVQRVGYLTALRVRHAPATITVSYDPPGLLVGAVISILALVGAVAALARGRKSRGDAAAPEAPGGNRTGGRSTEPAVTAGP